MFALLVLLGCLCFALSKRVENRIIVGATNTALTKGLFLSFLKPIFWEFNAVLGRPDGTFSLQRLIPNSHKSHNANTNKPPFGPFEGCAPLWRVIVGAIGCFGGFLIIIKSDDDRRFFLGVACFVVASLIWLTGHVDCNDTQDSSCNDWSLHYTNIVPHKYSLTSASYWGTVIAIRRAGMANNLPKEKQAAVIGALAEGSGIRQIERMTGVHRDTIMRIGVRIGQGCARLLDHKMRGLFCHHLQFDEVWGFIGKKQRHVQPEDDPQYGDVWTFCAIDSDTKLVPSFKVGKRDSATANAFVSDIASRLRNRVQISSDGLSAYVEAVEQAFGANVDYAQIVKVFQDAPAEMEVLRMDKTAYAGRPNMGLASTSHVERLNGTTRLHMRRLTRLTYAFSKKLENFEAAVALHFAYYNFVKWHNTLRCTPAMAAGIERDFWTVGDLLEAAA
jgi:IS1 family transposase